MTSYSKRKIGDLPRLPVEGKYDLTYRCNNACRHCWVRLPTSSPEEKDELSFDEVRYFVDEARRIGTSAWNLSGGEPMLRSDFPEIFDYLTRKAIRYSLTTNGTLITPEISKLLKRKGTKMITLYGATAEAYERVTRNPDGFEKVMQGLAYLKEAGTGFIVQLIPMRENYYQLPQMRELAQKWSPHWRYGASWLYLSASGSPTRNREITHQRLDPREVVELDPPDVLYEEKHQQEAHVYCHLEGDDRFFTACTGKGREFHVDPYGQMTFCSFIKDPSLRYDLRHGTFQEAWEVFIPSLSGRVRGGPEYLEGCGSCEMRSDCQWCPVHGYLEHRRFSAPVEYLCKVAHERRKFKEDWKRCHRFLPALSSPD